MDFLGLKGALTAYIQKIFPSKHFNFVLALLLGWYDFAKLNNVKLTLKQRWTTLNQHFNVDINNIRQRKNIVMFNVETTLWI